MVFFFKRGEGHLHPPGLKSLHTKKELNYSIIINVYSLNLNDMHQSSVLYRIILFLFIIIDNHVVFNGNAIRRRCFISTFKLNILL